MTRIGYALSSEEHLAGENDVAESVVCGPDPEAHREAIEQFVEAGYDHVYVHQVRPDQEGFFRVDEREIVPSLSG